MQRRARRLFDCTQCLSSLRPPARASPYTRRLISLHLPAHAGPLPSAGGRLRCAPLAATRPPTCLPLLPPPRLAPLAATRPASAPVQTGSSSVANKPPPVLSASSLDFVCDESSPSTSPVTPVSAASVLASEARSDSLLKQGRMVSAVTQGHSKSKDSNEPILHPQYCSLDQQLSSAIMTSTSISYNHIAAAIITSTSMCPPE
jgi:hypothetical protein